MVDAGHLVFDGVLDRDELPVGLVHVVQATVKRRGFSGARGSSDEDDAVGEVDALFELRLVVREEAQVGQPEEQRGFVEDAHHDAFAVDRGNRGNAEVDRLVRKADLDAAVLRQALFRDAHRLRHDFEPAHDGAVQAFRRGLHFLQDAIDAETDAELALERLDVDVARAVRVGLEQEHRNHFDDRRIALGRPAPFLFAVHIASLHRPDGFQ